MCVICVSRYEEVDKGNCLDPDDAYCSSPWGGGGAGLGVVGINGGGMKYYLLRGDWGTVKKWKCESLPSFSLLKRRTGTVSIVAYP